MNIEEIIDSALVLAGEIAPQECKPLHNLKEAIHHSGLKIVVMGDFKTGKSTLINRVFLKKDLLPIEYKESTSVPTRIHEGSLRMRAYESGNETPVIDLTEVDAATLANYITAKDETSRASLADRYSFVDLSMPDILPSGITLVDTPGLNTTNINVMHSTNAEARSADGIIYVCRAKTLSIREMERIQKLYGNQLHKFPLLVVLTADSTQTTDQVEKIRTEIEAQLNSVDISAHCAAFYLNEPTEQGLSDRVKPQSSIPGLKRKYGNSAVPTVSPSQGSGMNVKLKSSLESFISDEVHVGRMARVVRELKPILKNIEVELEAKLSASDKSEEELKNLQSSIASKKRQFENLVEDLLIDIRKGQLIYKQAVTTILDETQKECEQSLNTAANIGNIWEQIQHIQQSMPGNVANKLEILTLEYQLDIKKIASKYELNLKERFNVDSSQGQTEIDMGILAKIPGWLVTTLDYVIVILSSPLPWFVDVPLRVLAEKIVFLKKILPSSVAADIVRVKACNIVKTAMTNLKNDITKRLDKQFNECNSALRKELLQNSQLNIIATSVDEASNHRLSVEQKNTIKEKLDTVRQWLGKM